MTTAQPTRFERAQSGEDAAYQELVGEYARELYRSTYRTVGERLDAEDIVQEAFLRTHRKLTEYSSEQHWIATLHRTATNLGIDLLRRRGRWKTSAIEDREAFAPLKAVDAEPERAVRSEEIQRHLTAALDTLAPKERIAFTLRHYEGLRMKEISERTGTNINSTKNNVFRAVRKLRQALRPLMESTQ